MPDMAMDEALRLIAEFVRLGNSQAVADQDWSFQLDEAEAFLNGHLWGALRSSQSPATRALALVTTLANTPTAEWLSKPEIHAGLAEFATKRHTISGSDAADDD